MLLSTWLENRKKTDVNQSINRKSAICLNKKKGTWNVECYFSCVWFHMCPSIIFMQKCPNATCRLLLKICQLRRFQARPNQASINRSPKLRQTVGDKLHPGASGKFWSLGIRTWEWKMWRYLVLGDGYKRDLFSVSFCREKKSRDNIGQGEVMVVLE